MYHVLQFLCPNADEVAPPCINDPPKNKIAFLNPLVNITLTCNTSGISVSWKVNGTALSDLNNPDVGSLHTSTGTDMIVCTLEILGKRKYNGTVVQCVASVPGNGSRESQNATILIQGNMI